MDEDIEKQYQDIIAKIFNDMGSMTVFVPKVGLFKSKLNWMHNGVASNPTLQHITIEFVHDDNATEPAGTLSVSALFASSRVTRKPVLYFSIMLEFLQRFSGTGIILYGQEEMVRIIREHFEIRNDNTISVYLEHCNKFDYHRAALRAGSVPGWVYHRRSSGKNYRFIKGHILYFMDKFLHYPTLNDVPYQDLFKAKAKLLFADGLQTIVPRNWEEDHPTIISFVPIWNANPADAFVYDMEGDFFLKDVPPTTKEYIQQVKKNFPQNVITRQEIVDYLNENAKMFL